MFYKFNNIIGRIAPSTQADAYSPQGLNPLAREPSVITFDSKKTRPVQEPAVSMTRSARPASTSPATSATAGESLGVVPSNPRYQKIVQLQNRFLKDDGKLVWQKMGGRDMASYWATIGLVVVGTALCLGQIYSMSFPKKSED